MLNSIAIINYGMGNLTSVENALNNFDIKYEIINYYDLDYSQTFDGYILPGVGSFKKAMSIIRESQLDVYLQNEIIIYKKPILGICLGMQLLFESSLEDGFCEGLKYINGSVVNFESEKLKIPHVGWNEIKHNNNLLFENIFNNRDFYFDHSYYVKTNEDVVISKTDYISNFISAVNKENIYGVQFHPEKSQIFGLEVFKNFARICGVTYA